MSASRVAIAHDYLTQFGGAERVVATWSRLFPEAPIYTMAYAPHHTFPEFRGRAVVLPPFGGNRVFAGSVASFLPVLPLVASSIRVSGPVDWVLASTSGFAHGFRAEVPIVAYCHSPARWLYETGDYSAQIGALRRGSLRMMSGYLRRADRTAASRVTRYIANSIVTRERIWRAYGIEAPVVHPPVAMPAAGREGGSGFALPDVFALCVARRRGYKNLAFAADAARRAGIPLVVVGAGTEEIGSSWPGVHGLGRVSDEQLASLYAEASVLLAVAHEDFGLTPVEAAQAGTPTVAIDRGGYRETVLHGVNGLLVPETGADVADAVRQVVRHDWDHATVRLTAERFAPARHRRALLLAAGEVTGIPLQQPVVPRSIPVPRSPVPWTLDPDVRTPNPA
ncbi:glycosyltransferase [Pseudonocardia sp. KRD-184]|uniref:Glycosyltransferase n=1 Tax=Pseudonocardia oceani TaxID=2792013 RepID=A0ABS6U667_9PSEU|nr:glycosyltransferase [Pseudonocardia oceani]MBW0088899.1 glycosyltransferase [Pseudonocardia oceani]MBW0095872.1 glycosyltransferase [Pseudonocardia oceani]MBW0108663.1 glycosyltransferase [Pseudonocardia oceani]MBW0122599.1 glycosyltransferase [Pseudonocardia oceani]MBW0127717.1 glycosyltransferase [Pseudonocardia oceani]